jgi:hypothetical protein
MPSHSVKQAKVMSAIAHGWHPDQGSVAKIPLKVAKDFHSADAGHKYGKGMDKAKRAKRIVKKARKKFADGGDTGFPTSEFPGNLGDPNAAASFQDRFRTQRQPQGNLLRGLTNRAEDIRQERNLPAPHYADGGDTADDMIGAAQQQLATQQDRLPAASTGDPTAPDIRGDFLEKLTGDRNYSLDKMKENFRQGQEAYANKPYEERRDEAINVGMGAGPGIMVGPYGAHMLRAANRAAAMPHPVYGEEAAQAAERLRPEFRDAYKGWQADARDAQARATLESRQASGNPYDTDVWRGSGWFRGDEGMPRKEIPDIGASLKKIPGTDTYSLEHPAGDLHKIYDIPPIRFDPNMNNKYAEVWPDSSKIVIGGRPSDPGTVSRALHEIQHVIQKKEGFAYGSNPDHPFLSGKEEETFPGEGIPKWQKDMILADPRNGHVLPELENVHPADASRWVAYNRHAGEVEARNVQDRRAKSFRYQAHPEDTERVPRGISVINKEYIPRANKDIKIYDTRHMDPEEIIPGGAHRIYSDKYASGGGIEGGFNPERSEAYGLARQGMLHSSVPGRTDKLNLNVPAGSYVIPADIPSALGQGNSMAGANVLNKMFTKGPYGMNLSKSQGPRTHARAASLSKLRFADGGDTSATPIVAAGGEYIVHPDSVAELGHGDVSLGHDILDSFVKQVRDKHIQTLKGLKPPKGSK